MKAAARISCLAMTMLVMAFSTIACSRRQPHQNVSIFEQPFDRVYGASLDSPAAPHFAKWLPRSAYRHGTATLPHTLMAPAPIPLEAHLHPSLVVELQDTSRYSRMETLLVTYRETISIPRFPQADPSRS